MPKLTRRNFLISAAALSGTRFVPVAVKTARSRRVLTLVYDKSLGMMRAVDKVVR